MAITGKELGQQPAHPFSRITEQVSAQYAYSEGTMKREEFAKAALRGFLSAPGEWDRRTALEFTAKNVAALSCEYADALLAELAKDGAP